MEGIERVGYVLTDQGEGSEPSGEEIDR